MAGYGGPESEKSGGRDWKYSYSLGGEEFQYVDLYYLQNVGNYLQNVGKLPTFRRYYLQNVGNSNVGTTYKM